LLPELQQRRLNWRN